MAKALTSWVIRRLERSLVLELSDSSYGKIEKLINEMRIILDFLGDKKLGKGSRLNYFIADIADLVQEALNVEDDSSIYAKLFPLETWVGEVKMRMLKFGVDGAETSLEGDDGDDGDGDVVGLEKGVKRLLHRGVFSEEQQLQTATITGMVGIGKTTLARQVYNHADIKDRFDRRVWVSVANELSHKEVLMKLIQQVVDYEELERDSLLKKMEYADNRSLRQMLHQHLQGMRYFVVLDDWPEEMCLRSILKGLPHDDNGSRLLLTKGTYNIDAATHYNHEIRCLDYDSSWQLFLKIIFSGTSEHTFPKKLEKKAREMLTKCGGLPLAIKDVGKQLAKKRCSGSEWEEILQQPIDLSAILEILELSYHKFDPKLKSCFLHLALFKENLTVRAEKLMMIWAAGEIIPEFETKTYLYELISESIIEEIDCTIYDGTKNCRVNALHRLSIEKAYEDIGFEILSNNGNTQTLQSPRHRVIKCSRDKFNYSTNRDKHLVSLFFHGGGYLDASPSYWKSFELLKILDLEDFGLKILPESIGTLMELRYLGLRNNYIQELPHSLGCLKKLKVLDIALNFIVEVPDIIWELRSLGHIYMSDVICRKPLKVDALQMLVSLTYISVDNWTYELSGLQTLYSLSKLGIQELDANSNVSKLFASLVELKNLETLILRGFRFRSMPCLDKLGILHGLVALKLDGVLARLPTADNFPPNMRYLKLVNTRLNEDPMPLLVKLPRLFYLKLRNAYVGQEMVILQDGFPELQFLYIEELWNLRNIQVGEGAMPDLINLEIKNCPYLETLPEEIGSMSYVHKLKMVTTKNIATRIRKSGLISKIIEVDIKP